MSGLPPDARAQGARAQDGITIGHLAMLGLRRNPERPAFVQDGRAWSRRHVASGISAMARALLRLGLRPGDGVSALMANRPEVFMVRTAAQLIGCRYTALNRLAGPADLAHILRDAEIRLLVHDPAEAERAHAAAEAAGCPLVLSLGGGGGRARDLEAAAAEESGDDFQPVGDDEALGQISYTGGTTGQPKGVMLPHRALVQCATMMLAEYDWPAVPRMLLATPLSHAAGSLVIPVLLRGGTVHVLGGFEPEPYLRGIGEQGINCGFGVPTMIRALLAEPSLSRARTRGLETFIYGAAPIAPATLLEAMERIGPVFMQLYGQTEAPNTVCLLRRAEHDPARPALLSSCGQPMAGVDVRLLAEDGTPVPRGEPGEICVRGRLVMRGYWKRPQETEETLRHGWLHTGDIAREDEGGFLHIVDRRKDMIISGGFNVYPREVEDALATHPDVAAAAVIGVPDARWGERVQAFVVPRGGRRPDEAALAEHVRALKGPVQAPKSVVLVDALPTTPIGKIDKKALRAGFWREGARQVH
ncbi:acyl-CoA synthetase [Pseudoroseomonas rhizosphaerae]|uniref:Acyl-CoA synthetase n=1 Tax=Teichococcus rhizosphaerae TaxID=1335062 RepID=A0A2C7AEB4_9PROT|nr:AMP-binding protein [Pseudoroseomonas rhizosphaerae]PHK95414.1 acyl-CoA synthetase [Pseudoroseomonas rhizosphaerae]